jgi:hypothetical protein
MDLLRELTTHIAAVTGLNIGTELHAGNFPALEQERCAVVLAGPGEPSKPVLCGNVGDYAIQVLCRSGTDYFDCLALAEQIDAVLADCAGADLGEWQLHVCEGVTAPQFRGFDDRARWTISTNYTARATNKAAWAAV